jgi:hypothetical protein
MTVGEMKIIKRLLEHCLESDNCTLCEFIETHTGAMEVIKDVLIDAGA